MHAAFSYVGACVQTQAAVEGTRSRTSSFPEYSRPGPRLSAPAVSLIESVSDRGPNITLYFLRLNCRIWNFLAGAESILNHT